MSRELAAYKETANADAVSQDQLVEEHASLVKRIAYHLITQFF